jgi:hypothetical protein
MAQQSINLGTGPNTGTGEPIRTAFGKVNENFTEVYDLTNAASSLAQSAFNAANNASGGSANTGDFKFEDDEIYTETGKLFIYTTGAGEGEDNTVEISSDDFRVNANKNITLVVDEDVNIIAGNGTGTPREWIFGANGNLTFPDNTVQTTAYTDGNVFDQDLNTSNNVTFNDITSANITVESITLTSNTLVDGDESKILSVANSSGDGEGATTLELVPDVSLKSTDRFVIIDPTTPNHIHIRAGGPQDNSQASLFFGGENSYFAVDSGENPAVVISSNNNIWTFNTDGAVFFPDFSVQTTAFTANPTLDSTVTNNLKVESGIQVNYSNIANATGTVTHNCADGQIFNHITPTSNWTADFTNLQLENGYSTTITLVINQGATGYIANTILIDNSVTTIKWEGNVVPTPSTNSIDVLTFNLLKTGFLNGQVIILGQLTNFG